MGSAGIWVSEARANDDYRRLEIKHRRYDERLEELRTRKFLAENEKLEEVKLKKLKLALKDQMEAITRHSNE